MTKKKCTWVTGVKCVVCNKTGKVEDPHNSEKMIKCTRCGGEGMIITRGTSF